MQTCALRWRRIASGILFICIGVGTERVPAADVPVKKIILYKHGIGYFERAGTVPDGEEARLDFKNTDMNDVLKSLTVTDTSGGRVTGIRYDSNETLEQRLEKYPFHVGDQEFLSTFLDGMKGSRVELKSSEHTAIGAIVGARAIEAGANDAKHVVREQVTLLLDSGDVANYDLANLSSIRLLDARLQQQFRQYLQTIAQAKARDKRSIYIDSLQHGIRNLRISYISPTAIWKSSYRLTLCDADSMLEGWAIVDNTTDEDWSNVQLSVVSGRPISFISLLDTPRYGQRQVAELPEDRAAGPVVYGGAIVTAGDANGAVTGIGNGSGNGYGPGSGGGIGGGVYRPLAGLAQSVVTKAEVQQFASLQPSSVEGATGATLGELFEYNFAGPISIRRNQSAMLPFLQDKVNARKLLIYTERDGEHPVNAAEVSNNTQKTLDGGPITVYDADAYAGEALFETLKPGDKRLIGYAVDYGTRITTAFDTGRRNVREIHVKNGTLQLWYGEHQTRTYNIKNVDAKPKTLILQQEGIAQYSVLSPKPAERTATAYRFEVKVPASGSQALKVEEERTYENSTAVLGSTPDFLMTIVQNRELSELSRKQLRMLIDQKIRLAEAENSLSLSKAQMGDLTEDQTRLRQDIDSLNRVKGQEDQVRKYSTQLADNETQIAKLRAERSDLELRKAGLEADLKHAIDTLDF
jgi:hypothetical protein